jgi:phage shock protein C
MICTNCHSEIQEGARFCSACGIRLTPAYTSVHDAAAHEGLVRPRQGRAIAGVCAGFARRYGWDVAIVRLVLVLAVFFGCGTPFLAYIIAWVVMPNEPYFYGAPTATPPVAPEASQPQV